MSSEDEDRMVSDARDARWKTVSCGRLSRWVGVKTAARQGVPGRDGAGIAGEAWLFGFFGCSCRRRQSGRVRLLG